MGAWPTLLNPLNFNLSQKFGILREAFFSKSIKNKSSVISGDNLDFPSLKGTSAYTDIFEGARGASDQDDPNSPGGNRPRSITKGGGTRSLPSGSGNITKVPFDDPNFDPGKTRKKDTQIYLHWTAGSYDDASASYGYHTIFTGDGGIVRNKSYDARGAHTEGKNSNSVGLSLAAMAGATGVDNFGKAPVTHEQLNQMAAEAARLAVKWGWSEGDIDKNVWTHAEAGSGLDPRGLSGHLDYNGDGKPDNYGMFNRAPNERMHRWDLYTVKEGAEPGSGGPVLRDMIKKHFRNFKAELSGKEPPIISPRGTNDKDGPEALAPSGKKPETPTSTNDTHGKTANLQPETSDHNQGHGLDFSSLKGSSAYTDIFSSARSHAATSAGQRSLIFAKTNSKSISSSSISPVNLNSSDGLREETDYEAGGSATVVINRPYIINNNVYEGQNTPTSGRKYYT